MKNSDNKNYLNVYLAEIFVETRIFRKSLIITYNDSILTDKNWEHIAEAEISNFEEADQRSRFKNFLFQEVRLTC